MKPLLLCYSGCSTCKKAIKWLKENSIEVENREIATNNPTKEELKSWIERSEKPAAKFFNTSGMVYRSMGLKDKVKNSSEEELIDILASDGMVVKRPLLITDSKVLVGFKEDEWKELFDK